MLWVAIAQVSTPSIRSNSMEFVPSVMRLRLALGKYRLCHSVAKRVYPKQWLSWRAYKFIHSPGVNHCGFMSVEKVQISDIGFLH